MEYWGGKPSIGCKLGIDPLSPGLDPQYLTVLELAGLRCPLERNGTSPRPLAPYPWNSSSSLGWWAQVEEAKWIGEGQEVWVGEIVTAIGKEKTWSGQAGVMEGELEHWVATFLVHPSPAGPQVGRTNWSRAFS